MDLLWKCTALGLVASLLGLALKKENGEQTLLLGLAAAAMILTAALGSLSGVEETIRRAGERGGLSPAYTVPVLKSLGISILGKLSAGFCRDAGQGTVAAALELMCVCAVLAVSLPLVQGLLDVVFAYA